MFFNIEYFLFKRYCLPISSNNGDFYFKQIFYINKYLSFIMEKLFMYLQIFANDSYFILYHKQPDIYIWIAFFQFEFLFVKENKYLSFIIKENLNIREKKSESKKNIIFKFYRSMKFKNC